MPKTTPNYPIKVLTKTFSVLEILLEHRSPMSMSKISEKLDFTPIPFIEYWILFIRMISYVGSRALLHCKALGKVLLAYLPSIERKKILGKIEL